MSCFSKEILRSFFPASVGFTSTYENACMDYLDDSSSRRFQEALFLFWRPTKYFKVYLRISNTILTIF